jgi:hypothetical protein
MSRRFCHPERSEGSAVASAGPSLHASAEFSTCGRYRYSLTRIWNPNRPHVVFIGLNPSTADGTTDDPTIRRCLQFARDWRFGGLIVVNVFAYRSTDPRSLRCVEDPVGPRNDAMICEYCQSAGRVVLAWGTYGRLHGRDEQVLPFVQRPFCLGVTQGGSPRHPLYLPAGTKLRRFFT